MKKTEPTPLARLLQEFIREQKLDQGLMEGRVMNAWRSVVGADIAEATTRLYLRDGRLYVTFSSAVARSEFFTRRAAILQELNRQAGQRVVRFIAVG